MNIKKEWLERYRNRSNYTTTKRQAFFKLASYYLPKDKNAIIVDIGCSFAEFARQYVCKANYSNLYLLDCDVSTIDELKLEFKNVINYRIPDPLPFTEKSVAFLHCSHVIEHLNPHQLCQLILEIDRVTKKDAIIIISSPLLSDGGFYGDLDHVKPYPPGLLANIFCKQCRVPSIKDEPIVKSEYRQIELVERYSDNDVFSDIGFNNKFLDFLVFILGKMFHKIGLRSYLPTGYTLVIRKVV
jgi:SAM-dependent methyltransferase